MKIRIKKLLIFSTFLLAMLSAKAQILYVGANYHPHDDKDPEKIKKDIMLMQAAGFRVVRMSRSL